MNYERIKIVSELLGESKSEFIAEELKSAYNDLTLSLNELDEGLERSAIFSFDVEIERKKIKKFLKAFSKTYKWFGTGKIDG